MYQSQWLILVEAAKIIAARLELWQPDAYSENAALLDARRQLITALFEGALTARGQPFQIDTRNDYRPPAVEVDWVLIPPALWSNKGLRISHTMFRFDDSDSEQLDLVYLDWDCNKITKIESQLTHTIEGFCEIRLTPDAVDKIWTPNAAQTPAKFIEKGRYTTEWLELMREAISEYEISNETQPKAATLQEWFCTKTVGGVRVSRNLAKAMATFVRPPEAMVGGLKPTVPRKRRDGRNQ